MTTVPIEVVRRFYEALGRGDVLSVIGLLAPSLHWTEAERVPYYGGAWHSPQAAVQGLLTPIER